MILITTAVVFTLPVDLVYKTAWYWPLLQFVHIAHNLRYSSDTYTYASAIYSHSSCPCALLLCYWCRREMDRCFKVFVGAILRLDSLLGVFNHRRIVLVTHSIECWADPSFSSNNSKEKIVPRRLGIEHRFPVRPPRSEWSIYRNIFL
jgi:hypothetical protein